VSAAHVAAQEAQRLKLIRICQGADLDVRRVLRLARDDLNGLADYADCTLLAYARALLASDGRRRGAVPVDWTSACRCQGCGPVLLWDDAPLRVLACPWCLNRLHGLPIPRPAAGP